MSHRISRSLFSEHKIFFFLWMLINVLVVGLEVRLPGSDVFLFKEAGVNLATRGRFVASNLVHMPFDVEFPFTFYPPLYPFLFGIWSWIFGVGLMQSSSFDCLLRGIRTLLLAFFAIRILKQNGQYLTKTTPWVRRCFLFILLLISLFSTDNDRPEELALIFGLGSWLVFDSASKTRWLSLLSGALLGLTASTAPAGAVFFAMGIFFYALVSKKNWPNLFTCAFVSILIVAMANLPTFIADPQAYARFSVQAFRSTKPYINPFSRGMGFEPFWLTFSDAMRMFARIGIPYIACLVGFAASALLSTKHKNKPAKSLELTFLKIVSLVFVPMVILLWTVQPYYLWYSIIALTVVGLVTLCLETSTRMLSLRISLIALGLLPLSYREIKGIAIAAQRPWEETSKAISEKVLAAVPPGERMAVSHDEYFTFRNKRNISSVEFVCPWLDRYPYVFVSAVRNSNLTRESPLPIPCEQHRQCFAVKEDFSTNKVFTLLGLPTSHYVRGFSGVLYKNIHCSDKIKN
ncbi:MAG: hypothetical protein HY537_17755 [Deltaproteobacteria bacterium]|nr:hypothetical protein [Deltaproteobacteria bacterium]